MVFRPHGLTSLSLVQKLLAMKNNYWAHGLRFFLTFIFTLYRSVHIRLQGRKKTLEFDVAVLTLCKTASCPSLRVGRWSEYQCVVSKIGCTRIASIVTREQEALYGTPISLMLLCVFYNGRRTIYFLLLEFVSSRTVSTNVEVPPVFGPLIHSDWLATQALLMYMGP